MSIKTRKRIWPVSVVAVIGMVAILAALAVTALMPGATQAQGAPPPVAGPSNLQATADSASQISLSWSPGLGQTTYELQRMQDSVDPGATFATIANDITMTSYTDSGLTAGTTYSYRVRGVSAGGQSPWSNTDMATTSTTSPTPMAGDVTVNSSSTSGSATVELKLSVKLKDDVPVGGALVLYLEDDFQIDEPDSISASDVYFVSMPPKKVTGNGSRVYATQNPEIDTDEHFTKDKDDFDIRLQVPDMCANNEADCEGANGLMSGDTVTVVIQKSAGIKNPSEAGDHSVGASVLGPTDNVGGPMYEGDEVTIVKSDGTKIGTGELKTVAKITLSDVDNSRGYELTVTGSGFNNGTSAAVHVLYVAGTDPDDKSTWPSCAQILAQGTRVHIGTVESNDKVDVEFEVTVPTFGPGNHNYICMVDGEGRMSDTDVEDFKLEPSIRVVPDSASTGDTINVFAQDYPQQANNGFTQLKIAGQDVTSIVDHTSTSINQDGSGTVTFELPGSISGNSLEGTLRIDAQWGDVSEDGKVKVIASALRLSQSEVRANDSITIQGEGFGGQTTINPADITMDGVPLHVDNDSLDGGVVKVSNAGQFVATVAIWNAHRTADNPALIPGTHTIKVRDSEGFLGTAPVKIKAPSIMTLPLVAGPRDVITITGENWPVDNPDGGSVDSVEIEIDDDPNRQPRKYTAIPDLTGRFTLEHRVSRDVGIPSDNQIKVTYGDSGEIVEISSFAVPESIIEVSPAEAQPGEMISLSVSGMPVYTNVFSIEVGGRNVLGGQNFSTDRTGAVTSEVTVPGLDPGTYSVIMEVGEEEHLTIAIGEVEILSEGAIGTEITAAEGLANLGDNLVAVFHFNNAAKEWSFYDPRPEFADLNTLENMVQGEAYWILVAEGRGRSGPEQQGPQSHLPWRRLLEPGGLVDRRPRRGAIVNRLNECPVKRPRSRGSRCGGGETTPSRSK